MKTALSVTVVFAALALAGATGAVQRHHVKHPAAVVRLPRPVIGSATLSGADLLQYAAYRRAFVPKDDFDALPPEADLDGKPFEFSTPVMNLGSSGGVYWQYDSAARQLTLAVGPAYLSAVDFMVDFPQDNTDVLKRVISLYGLYIETRSRSKGSYVGANAFGATRSVDSYAERFVGVATMSEELGRLRGTQKITLSPDAARRAVAGARVIVEGRLRAYRPGKVLMCGHHYIEPTIDGPIEISQEMCVFNAEIAQLKVVDASGAVLVVWGP